MADPSYWNIGQYTRVPKYTPEYMVGWGPYGDSITRDLFWALQSDTSLSGSADVSSSGYYVRVGSSTLTGEATLTSNAYYIPTGASTLTGEAAVSCAAYYVGSGACSLTGTGGLTVLVFNGGLIASAYYVGPGLSNLSGTATLTASGISVVSGSSTLTGAGTFTAAGSYVSFASCSLTGAGTLTGVGGTSIPAVCNLSGSCNLSASGRYVTLGAVTLTGAGTLSGTGGYLLAATAALTGEAALSADGYVFAPVGIHSCGKDGLAFRDQYSGNILGAVGINGFNLFSNLAITLKDNNETRRDVVRFNELNTLQLGAQLSQVVDSGDTLDVSTDGSFIMVVADLTDGEAAMFKCMAGSVTKWFGDTNIVAGAPSSGEVGLEYSSGTYRINNNKATNNSMARFQLIL